MSLCPGACNAAYWRAETAYQAALASYVKLRIEAARLRAEFGDGIPLEEPIKPEPHGIDPVLGAPIWCEREQWLIRRQLLALDDLGAVLQATIDGHRPTSSSDRVTGSHSAPSPAPAVDLYDQLLGDLLDWEHELRGIIHLPGRPHLRTAIALTRTIAWLAMHCERLLAGEDGERFGRQVLNWHRRLEAATKTIPDRVRKPGRCPRCHTACLVLRDTDRPADRRVECESCQRILTMDEYDDLADQQTGATR